MNSLPVVNKSELESKHIAELHELAAQAGVERYRMLSRAELIEKLAGGNGKPQSRSGGGRRAGQREQKSRPPRQRRRPEGKPRADSGGREPQATETAPERSERKPQPSIAPATTPPPGRPKRKRRRRRWGRRAKSVRVHDLLLPAGAGRQAIVYADTRAGCTALLREVAAELSDASNGPDPIALLIDPTPEELADWKREAPQAEIVAAGKANHADDAIAQARTRAGTGEEVIVLIDSLSRFAESFAGPDEARELFNAGQGGGGGSLTVVAAVERPV